MADEILEGEVVEAEPEPGEVVDAEVVDETTGVRPTPRLDVELPDDADAAVEVLTDALATAQQTTEAYLDDLRRLAADYENFRKRAARDRDEIVERSSQRLVEALLPVLDSFDAAFTHDPQSPSEEKLVAGVRGTYHQLMDILGKEGLEVIPALGEPFDPSVHEAVAGGGGDDLVVTAEMRRGYTLKGRVIRPTLVAVGPDDADEG
ncbi:MAG: nucleotide exchange factor GrpE [Acidimicrobiia bacterium]|nr:nucleotide exchange factor GrpE [Acidimicrobiia bacterium]